MRDKIAEIIAKCVPHMFPNTLENDSKDVADQILAIPITASFPCKECGGKWDAPRCGLKGGAENCPHDFCHCDMDGDCDAIVAENCHHCHEGMVEETLCAVEVGINPEYFNKVEIVTPLTPGTLGEHRDTNTWEWRVCDT